MSQMTLVGSGITDFSHGEIVDAGLKRVHVKGQQPPAHAIPRFVGCDGEGGTVNGESAYYLLRIGSALLYPGKERRITTLDAFNFMWGQAQKYDKARFVGFFFDYDISNILRDVPRDILRRLADRESRTHTKTYTDKRTGKIRTKEYVSGVYYRGFRFDHIPRKYFSVERVAGNGSRIGRKFHIDDTSGFFQCAFLKAIQLWGIGEQHWEMIERNKLARVNMTGVYSTEEIEYNRLECELLEELMRAVATEALHVGIKPSYWTGAGALAQALLQKHGAARGVPLPPAVRECAQAAFHAGRFETRYTGKLYGPIYELDLASAYPWAITQLPCLGVTGKNNEFIPHGTWVYRDDIPEEGTYLANIRWTFNSRWVGYSKDPRSAFGPFPVRRDNGSIYYPREGSGWYWSPEIRAALKISTGQRKVTHPYDFDILGCWEWVQSCDCGNPFGWVTEIYEERKRIGKGGRGLILKLALNSLYGKFAQSVGNAPYGNPVYAGLITAYTRAKMLDVIATGVRVAMVATDGIYLLDMPDIPNIVPDDGTASLGQWECAEIPDLFIAKPGHYWSETEYLSTDKKRKVKTRGVSYSAFVPHIVGYRKPLVEELPCTCNEIPTPHTHVPKYADEFRQNGWNASVDIHYNSFVGYRLAVHRRDERIFCQWIQETTTSSSKTTIAGASRKRNFFGETYEGAYVTEPLPGNVDMASVPYTKVIGAENPFEFSLLFEGPDYGRGFGDDITAMLQ